MDNKLELIIKKSLDLYDDQNDKYKELIQSTNVTRLRPSNINKDRQKTFEIPEEQGENRIFFNNDQDFYYEILGVYDLKNRIWAWSWLFPMLNKSFTYESRHLLNYALDKNIISLNDQESLFIKTQLTNSRLSISDSVQLDILIGLCSYLLQDRIRFIYPEINKDNSDIIHFILIK